MQTSESIGSRLASNKRRIGADARVRFAITGLSASPRVERAAESFIDALATALSTEDTAAVAAWVHAQKGLAPAYHIREIAHVTCMAVASETAQFCRGSFREVMRTLQRVEALIAKLVHEPKQLRTAA